MFCLTIDTLPNRDWKQGQLTLNHACHPCLPPSSWRLKMADSQLGKFSAIDTFPNRRASMISVICFIFHLYLDLQMFRNTVGSVLTDKGFEIATEKAQRACLCASRLLKWIKSNEKEAATFATNLMKSLRQCCMHPRPILCHTLKERMWQNYYKLCSSDDFRTSWIHFLEKSIGFEQCATFYQFVTKTIIQEIIKMQFPIISSPSQSLSPIARGASLDFEESNALHYCGGYLLKSLKKKVTKSAHSLKESLLLCLEDLLEAGLTHSTSIVTY